jgi:hypothetical protein
LNRTAVLAQIKHLLQAGVILRLLGIASEQRQLIFRKASRKGFGVNAEPTLSPASVTIARSPQGIRLNLLVFTGSDGSTSKR